MSSFSEICYVSKTFLVSKMPGDDSTKHAW